MKVLEHLTEKDIERYSARESSSAELLADVRLRGEEFRRGRLPCTVAFDVLFRQMF